MVVARFLAAVFAFCSVLSWGATLGKVVPLLGGGSDLVLDESRDRLYLTSSAQNLVQVYSAQQQMFLAPIATDSLPIGVALSRDGQRLYVTCYGAALLDVIDLTALTVSTRISLPARPLSVAVGSDERVLISTTGSGAGNASDVLLLYDPSPNAQVGLTSITIAPGPASAPTVPAPSGRAFLSSHSQLRATRDGSIIAGVNVTGATGTVFVYQASSATVLRSRVVTGASNVIAISDDGTRLHCGALLFETSTLRILGQVNVANAPYPIPPATSFTTQANQGGSVFSPDGQTLYASFNVVPVQNPPVTTNIAQLMLSDPDNLLVHTGLQLPEFLAGKMVIGADGANAYALSDSGFVVVPLGTVSGRPLAELATDVVLLTNDQCGVNQGITANVAINNPGKGRVTAAVSLLQFAGVANQPSPGTAPSTRSAAQITFGLNAAAARGYGTILPPHDFIVQSPEAINIPDRVRVYQNNRDSDARGTILPIPVSITAAAGLTDLAYDQTRQRIYIANAGLNRVEVFDVGLQQFLSPVKVGQLPASLALAPDGSVLYVANAGGESISIVDPDKLQTTGSVVFPPIPFGSNLPPLMPVTIAAGLSGVQILMSNGTNNGTLWKVVGSTAVPRGVSIVIGLNSSGGPATIPVPSTMAATPDGQYILLFTNTGIAYLYDASLDDFVAGRQVFPTAPAGYLGPVAAGPGGQYFVVNSTLLNQALVPVTSALGFISAVTAAGPNSYAMFSTPASPPNALPTTQPTIQIVNATTGNTTLQVPALEGPLTQVSGAARATIGGRTMAIDSAGATAFVLTTSGLSIVPLTPVAQGDRPLPNPRGTVNLGSYQAPTAQNGLISIFGQNLAESAIAGSTPLPVILGGTCVTLNNVALPLFMTSPGQINAQIPPTLAVGSYPLVVRSITKQAASTTQPFAVSKYAPAVLVDGSGQILLFHADGKYVNKDNPANRDEPLTMYAVGLGLTTGGKVTAGVPSPSTPLARTSPVNVYFGDPLWVQAGIIVDFSGLAPGMIGVYQLNLRVPGFHISGDSLLVTLKVGGVSSLSTGPVVPHASVN